MSNCNPRLSVIIPVYNEVKTVSRLVDSVRNCGVPAPEIVVVDDGSDDGTRSLLAALPPAANLHIIRHDVNCGKGHAVRSAQKRITGEAVVVQDADLEYSPSEFPRMLALIEEGHADAVYGSRYSGRELQVDSFWHYNANRLVTTISNLFSNLHLTDMETCYKMIRGDLFRHLRLTSNRFGIEAEITARLAQLSARIWEVPIAYRARGASEGKKIGWQDGCATLWHIVNFNIFDRQKPPSDGGADDSPPPPNPNSG